MTPERLAEIERAMGRDRGGCNCKFCRSAAELLADYKALRYASAAFVEASETKDYDESDNWPQHLVDYTTARDALKAVLAGEERKPLSPPEALRMASEILHEQEAKRAAFAEREAQEGKA